MAAELFLCFSSSVFTFIWDYFQAKKHFNDFIFEYCNPGVWVTERFSPPSVLVCSLLCVKCSCMLAWMCLLCDTLSLLSTEMPQLEQNCGVINQNRWNGETTGAAEKTKEFSLLGGGDVQDGCNLLCHGHFDLDNPIHSCNGKLAITTKFSFL